MRAVLVQVPESLLEQRRRTGMHRFDERWEGVWHLVPTASAAHGILGAALYEVLAPVARRLGLQPFFDGTGLYRTIDDYRVSDQQYVRPEVVTDRGTGPGADLVVELRSPDDETYAKLDWYAGMSVREVLVVDVETRVPQLFVTVDGRPLAVLPGEDGAVRSQVLGVTFTVVGGPRLRVGTPSGDAEV